MRVLALLLLGLLALSTFSAFAADEKEAGPPMSELSEEQRDAVKSQSETHEFQAEVSRMMDIIINSLYSQREVFLRELISNAADALEKVRVLSLSDSKIVGDKPELEIFIDVNEEEKTISISDSGIGMTKEDLINNLGTVAKSGTSNFLEALSQGGDVNLIGQFGVGFYSAYLVADRVVVVSKNNDDDQYVWESSADPSFVVFKDPRGNTLKRGTRITLHLKEDATEFLKEHKLRELVRRFSQFVSFPIKLLVEKEVEVDAPEEETEKELEDVAEESKEKKKIKQKQRSWEHINTEKAVWLRPKEEVTEEEYKDFYRVLTSDYREPLGWSHFTAEGEVEFRALLYIPAPNEHDAWSTYFAQKQHAIRLYVRRVLVADEFSDVVPKWMSFIKGVVDSDDLPLKVDRESLAKSRAMSVITKKLARKFLELLKKLLKEDVELKSAGNSTETRFDKFWKAFGRNVKIACIEDDANREKISKLFRYRTSKTKENETVTFEEYIKRMPESQKEIYFIATDSREHAMTSPYMQYFLQKDLEVLIGEEPVDEPCFARLGDVEGKRFVSIEKNEVKFDHTEADKKKHKALEEYYMPLTDYIKKVMSKKIRNVGVSKKLVDDPLLIYTDPWGYSAYAERVLKAQTFGSSAKDDFAAAKHLEFNPNHPIIKKLRDMVVEDAENPELQKMTTVLIDNAFLASGFHVDEPRFISTHLYSLLQQQLGVPADAKLEEPDVPEPAEVDKEHREPEEEIEEDNRESDEAANKHKMREEEL